MIDISGSSSVAPSRYYRYKSSIVRSYLTVLFCAGTMLAGCGVARDAAVTSYHVATAPVRIVARQFEDRPPPPVERTNHIDTNAPVRPIATPPPTRYPRSVMSGTQKPKNEQSDGAKSQSGSTPSSAPSGEFPVAKSVPGKPGYVFSPYDQGKYVDVSGYASGSKVKDPYAQKIFIVP